MESLVDRLMSPPLLTTAVLVAFLAGMELARNPCEAITRRDIDWVSTL